MTVDLSSSCRIGAEVFHIRKVGADEMVQMERLFARVFGFVPPHGWHTWKYGMLKGTAIGLWNARGELVAHYAGFPRTLLCEGQHIEAVQIGDVMVAPEVRGLLTRRGPFFRVCAHFFAEHVGAEKDFMLAFGFPNERHMRLGTALNLYHGVGVMHQLVWPARPARLPLTWTWKSLQPDKDLARTVDKAWCAMADDFSGYIIGVRNPAYIEQRFASRPGHTYRFFRLQHRFSRSATAVAIMRFASGQVELLDIIGPQSMFPLVVKMAATEAAVANVDYLSTWASPAATAVLQKTDARIETIMAHLAVARASVISEEKIRNTLWWWMGGDTDFL
jgi:hypothetical protein